MADLDLRPLTLGEILDRTFTLYRRHFLLFVGITALPQLLVLAFRLFSLFAGRSTRTVTSFSSTFEAFAIVGALIGVVVYLAAYLYAQGGTVFAVSELYLGRSTTIAESLKRMHGEAASLFGVILLNGLAIIAGLILLIIPGIYVACRLITCIPAALLENLNPSESLSRSFALTKGRAGRAFVIYLLYLTILYAATFLFLMPFTVGLALAARNPSAVLVLTALTEVGTFIATVLVTPIFTIATALFYYDLRVRKEGFDLQMMINPSGSVARGAAGVPTMLT